jgi:hypothetical protein
VKLFVFRLHVTDGRLGCTDPSHFVDKVHPPGRPRSTPSCRPAKDAAAQSAP